jgi:hypothetical protein
LLLQFAGLLEFPVESVQGGNHLPMRPDALKSEENEEEYENMLNAHVNPHVARVGERYSQRVRGKMPLLSYTKLQKRQL